MDDIRGPLAVMDKQCEVGGFAQVGYSSGFGYGRSGKPRLHDYVHVGSDVALLFLGLCFRDDSRRRTLGGMVHSGRSSPRCEGRSARWVWGSFFDISSITTVTVSQPDTQRKEDKAERRPEGFCVRQFRKRKLSCGIDL